MIEESTGKLRFAVLRHFGVDEPHFDLLFETAPGSALLTFRSPSWPILEPTEVVRLRDHRRAYLDYEGPIGGERGEVQRVHEGTYALESFAPNGRFSAKLDDGSELVIERDIARVNWPE